MIYVVDDAADYRFLVQQVFRMFLPQYPVRLFADGLELIHHINESRSETDLPKVILLDVDMPKLSGTQTLERLKQHPMWAFIPVVMVSNRADNTFVSACYKQGACSFLLKPMSIDQLQQMMTMLCYYWSDLNQQPSSQEGLIASDKNSLGH